MSVRPLGGGDYRYLFHSINNASIDTPRIIEESYKRLHRVEIPTVFHDKEPGKLRPARMNFKARLNIIS